MSKLRIAAAVVAMLLVQWSTGTLLALTTQANGSITQTVISGFTGAFAGGFVAKRNFIIPAVTVWAAVWCALTYVLHGIDAETGSASIVDILNRNAVPLLLSGLGILSGALIGQAISGRRPRPAVAT